MGLIELIAEYMFEIVVAILVVIILIGIFGMKGKKMSIFKSISNIFHKGVDAIDDSLKDADRDSQIAIEKSEAKIATDRQKLTTIKGNNIQLRNKAGDLIAEIAKYGRLAEAAVSANNDADASQALEIQTHKENELKTVQTQITENTKVISSFETNIETLIQRVEKAKSDHVRLKTALENAKLRKDLADNLSSGNTGNFADLDALSAEVDKQEAEAQAVEETAATDPTHVAENLEHKYLKADTGVDEKLAALKTKLGK